jgi:hypothetical protein
MHLQYCQFILTDDLGRNVMCYAQVGTDGKAGESLSRFSLQSPVVEYDANVVPPYSPEWGAAWSSQKTACPACCARHETCNIRRCEEARIFFDQCLVDTRSFPISNLVDGDEGTVYKPDCLDCGRQWFVVGIQEPLYLHQLQILISGVEGHVTNIQGALIYAGNDTDWDHVWAAAEGSLRPRDLLSAVEWAPRLCPHYSTPMRWFRVEYDTTNVTILPGFHRVKVSGSLGPHASAEHGKSGKLLYESLPGVKYASDIQDSIVMRASDCVAWSSPLTVTLANTSGQHKDLDTAFGELQVATVALRVRSLITIDLGPAAAHIEPYLLSESATYPPASSSTEQAFSTADFQVVLEGLEPGTGLAVYKADTGEEVLPGEELVLGAGGGEGVLVEDDSFLSVSLYFRATYADVTYRLHVEVRTECPAGASIFDCARGPEDCIQDCVTAGTEPCPWSSSTSESIVFDPWNGKCVLASDADDSRSDLLPIVGITLGAIVALAALLLLWFKVLPAPVIAFLEGSLKANCILKQMQQNDHIMVDYDTLWL